jgi:hypothetical protein
MHLLFAETDPHNAGRSIRGRRLLRGDARSLVAKNAHDKRSIAQLFARVALSQSRPVDAAPAAASAPQDSSARFARPRVGKIGLQAKLAIPEHPRGSRA